MRTPLDDDLTFQDYLANAIQGGDPNDFYGQRILHLLNSPDSLRKRVALNILQRHAEAHLATEDVARTAAGAIDWSQIDWAKWLGILLKLFVTLLPLLLL